MESANVAATLAQGLIGALTSIWQYYLSVVLGLIALIAAISQTSTFRLNTSSRIIITLAAAIFCFVNFRSIYGVTIQLNELAKVIRDNAPALKTALSEDIHTTVLWIHPIGLILPVVWLWTFDRGKAK